MGVLGTLFPLLWFLAFLSPIAAIFFAVRFYVIHRRRRPEPDRRVPVVAYVVVLLVGAIIAFPFGLFLGISAACSGPGAGNLCGLFAVFVTGPVASSLAIFLVSGLIAALPAVEPAPLPVGEAASIPADTAPVIPPGTAAIDAKTSWYRKLWRGEYSLAVSFWGFFILGTLAVSFWGFFILGTLAVSFWGFFILGTLVGTIIRMNPAFLFLPIAALVFQPVFLGYQITAGIGVWRSADALGLAAGGRPSPAHAPIKTVAAKTVVVLFIAIHAIQLLRTLSLLPSYSHL